MATDPQGLLDLVDWRRRVGDLYRISGSRARAGRPQASPARAGRIESSDAIDRFRRGRDELFRSHPQSPIEPDERSSFAGLHYYPHDPAYRVDARFEPADGSELLIDTGGEDGAVRYRRGGHLVFRLHGVDCRLTVLSLAQYAGGLFVPFRDATSGRETYGGGRYLFDTIKNHLPMPVPETGKSMVEIDFNYAYNPSCAYNQRWACPLAPQENWLPVPIRAGEKNYKAP